MVASFASFVITQLKQKLLLGTHSVHTQRHVHTRITNIFWGIFLIQFISKQKISKQTRKSLNSEIIISTAGLNGWRRLTTVEYELKTIGSANWNCDERKKALKIRKKIRQNCLCLFQNQRRNQSKWTLNCEHSRVNVSTSFFMKIVSSGCACVKKVAQT